MIMPQQGKCLTFNQIKFRNEKAAISGMGAVKVYIKEKNGLINRGYYKACNEKYPPILAKYVVAFSVFVRSMLGDRASEERLVFNEKDEIVGTASVEIPDFIPLRAIPILPTTTVRYVNPIYEYWAVPDKLLLLETDMAELLLVEYYGLNNDLHPANISIKGVIDYDEFFFTITSIFKEWKQTIIKLTQEEIRNFPKITYGSRKHWVTYNVPYNWNITKIYQTNAFNQLNGDSIFELQKYAAILKILLSYDKNMLQKRMKLYLGDTSLKLDELPKEQFELLYNYDKKLIEDRILEERGETSKTLSTAEYEKIFHEYQTKYSLLFDEKGKEHSFVQHCSRYFEEEHQKFLCEVLTMPEFRDFIIAENKSPDFLSKIKLWFKQNNRKNIDAPYNLAYINQLYHFIWRESFRPLFENQCKFLEKIASDFSKSLDESHNKSEYKFSKIKMLSSQIINPGKDPDLSESVILIDKPEKNVLQNSFSKICYQRAQKETQLFLQTLLNFKETYYAKKSDLSIKDNHEFIKNFENYLHESDELRKNTKKWLYNENKSSSQGILRNVSIDHLIYDMEELYKELDIITANFLDILKQFRLNEGTSFKTEPPSPILIEQKNNVTLSSSTPKLERTNSFSEKKLEAPLRLELPPPLLTVPSPDTTPGPPSAPPERDEEQYQFVQHFPKEAFMIDTISNRLCRWLGCHKLDIKSIVIDTYTEYDSLKRERGIRRFFEKTSFGPDVMNQTLLEIFASPNGGWNETSFKPLLIKNLISKMLTSTKKDDALYETNQWIYEEIMKNKKMDWWSKEAENIAKKSGLKKEKTVPHETLLHFS